MSIVSIEQVKAAGVVGAGGAGFPTHVKLSAEADTVVLNAAECEPLLHKDKEVLKHYPDQVLAGLTAAMSLVGASRGAIGIKGKYEEVIASLRKCVPSNIEIVPLPDTYPSGDEFILVYDVLGRVIPPGGLPLHVGAVVINVETALNIANAPSKPVTEKYLTIGGGVAEPVTLRVPVGITLGECLAAAGGPTVPEPCLMVGGVMMGYLAGGPDELVDKTTGGVIVLDASSPLIQRRRQNWQQIARIGRSACDQCSFCTELCPRWLLGHPIEPHKAMRSLGFNLTGEPNVIGTAFCCECNLCSLYSCPEDLDPKNVCVQNKRRLAAEGRRWEQPPFLPERAKSLLPNRRAPTARLMHKLGLNRFRNVGPLREETLTTRRVGIKLKQHVGAPCQPVVSVGQQVQPGQLLAEPPVQNGKKALGAPVHASIGGTVKAIENGVIWIDAQAGQ